MVLGQMNGFSVAFRTYEKRLYDIDLEYSVYQRSTNTGRPVSTTATTFTLSAKQSQLLPT